MKKLTSLVSLISLWALPLAYSGSASADMILVLLQEGVNDGIEFEIDPDDGLIINEQLDGLLGIDVTYLSNTEDGATVNWVFDADGDPLNGNQLLNPQTSGGLTITGTTFKPEPDSTEAIAGTWSWNDSLGTLDYLSFKYDNWLAVYQITGGMTSGDWSNATACSDGVDAGFISDTTACTNMDDFFALSHSSAYTTTVVPVPAAVWLFGSGLLGLIGIARRR